MTISFADQFDIPQVSKKYSVILKGRQCLRGYVLTRFFAVPYFCRWKCQRPRSCSATCKWLRISCLTEIRVVVFTTLKMPKALIASGIRAAHPGGSCQTALCLIKL